MYLTYNVSDKPKFGNLIVFAIQQLLAIMAATIVIPMIVSQATGVQMSISAALVGAGFGTIVYLLFTKFKSPVFLGSSFAFLGSMAMAFTGAVTASLGYLGLIIGALLAGLGYVIVAVVTKFVKGEIDKDEHELLPALIPFCFINGLTGIPSGLPTLNIPTMDMDSLFDYYIDILSHKDVNYQPKKLPLPNFELDILSSKKDWENLLKTGKGTIKVSPVMSIDKNGIITIISLPGSKNIETVQKIIEPEYLSEKVDIRDESTDKIHIVIEKVPRKQCNMQKLYERLYKKLQSSDNYNMAFFDEEKIYVPCSFNKVVRANLQHVIETHKNRIAKQSDDLKIKLRVLEVIDELKVSNNIKKIAELSSDEAVEFIATKYKVDKNIASKVFQKPLSYLTKEHSQELEDLRKNIAELENDDKDIYEFLLKKYKKLKAEIGKINNGRFLETKFIIAK